MNRGNKKDVCVLTPSSILLLLAEAVAEAAAVVVGVILFNWLLFLFFIYRHQ